jgi:hypothetical protein
VFYLKIILIACLLALGPIGYVKGRMDGKRIVKAEWQTAQAQANLESRRLEQRRQDRANEAAKLAVGRTTVVRVDDSRVGDSVIRLRNAISAQRMAEESAAAATERANRLGELLVQSAEAHRELAGRCDRHVNDIKHLLDAWPR